MALTLFLIIVFHFFKSVAFPLLKKLGEKWIDRRFKDDN